MRAAAAEWREQVWHLKLGFIFDALASICINHFLIILATNYVDSFFPILASFGIFGEGASVASESWTPYLLGSVVGDGLPSFTSLHLT